jgi:hypothetical protein
MLPGPFLFNYMRKGFFFLVYMRKMVGYMRGYTCSRVRKNRLKHQKYFLSCKKMVTP